MHVEFIPPSEEEFYDAYYYYSLQLEGLEDQFLQEFEKTIELIKKYPEAWRKMGLHTRRGLLKRFPYFILYVIENDKILITCIAHQHRDPEYYIDRIL